MTAGSKVFPNNIALLRKNAGLSQMELAEKVFVKNNWLNKVENGKFKPSLSLLERIAEALNVRLDEIFLK